MNLETRAREARQGLQEATPVDLGEALERVHRTHRRRTTGKVIAAAAAVALAIGVVQTRAWDRSAIPPASWDSWVLVTGDSVGTDLTPPIGDEWSRPLGDSKIAAYPYWASVDQAGQRFLIYADEGTALEVMTPGRVEPLYRYVCDADGTGCLGATLGPGPQELTMVTGEFNLVIAGPAGISPLREAPANAHPAGWSPDGRTLALRREDNGRGESSLEISLWDADSTEESALYSYSEAAPRWYDPENHRFADWPGAFNGWGAPHVLDLQWAPDSTRLAFVTVTTPEGPSDDRRVQWQVFVADADTGDVEKVADVGECSEPVGKDGTHDHMCDRREPYIGWTPDGASLTVLMDSVLTSYELDGLELTSDPTEVEGFSPSELAVARGLAWLDPD